LAPFSNHLKVRHLRTPPAKKICGGVDGGFFWFLSVARQQVVNLVGRMSADACQNIPEVCKRVNFI
jgi:hypothetical protein